MWACGTSALSSLSAVVAHDFLPHAWGLYRPTLVEFGIMIGSFCLFFFLFVLFVKHMPSVAMTEMKETVHEGEAHDH
jgi:Ni/Fe-hydrogenase subunit HybB-like protein